MSTKDDNRVHGDICRDPGRLESKYGHFSPIEIGMEVKVSCSDFGDGNMDYAPSFVKISASMISLCIPFCRQVEVELKLKHEKYEDIWCFSNDV